MAIWQPYTLNQWYDVLTLSPWGCHDMASNVELWYFLHCQPEEANSGITGPRFSIKLTSYQYRKSHCGDKTILRPSYLPNGISYTGKITSLYWIGALVNWDAMLLMWHPFNLWLILFQVVMKMTSSTSGCASSRVGWTACVNILWLPTQTSSITSSRVRTRNDGKLENGKQRKMSSSEESFSWLWPLRLLLLNRRICKSGEW